MPTRLLPLMLLLTVVCSAQTPSPEATPSSKRYVIKLTEPTQTQPVTAYIGEHRFHTVEQLKKFINGLPKGSRVHFNWYGENLGDTTRHSDFFKAGRELHALCEAHGLVWTSRAGPCH